MKRDGDKADAGFDAEFSRLDASQVGQGHGQADGPVAAHAQVADVVEENDAGDAGGVLRFDQDRADHDIGAARFVDDGGAELIVLFEQAQLVGNAAAAQIGSAADDDAGRLAAGVGINGGNFFHSFWPSFEVIIGIGAPGHCGWRRRPPMSILCSDYFCDCGLSWLGMTGIW